MKSKVTIIIPVYKVEKYLSRCLDSILNQTLSDWKAIVVDDGSPDMSGKIADEYAEHDARFVVVHKKNEGVSAARNYALNMADGEYIMFLDSDDCIHPQTMEILYTIAKRENVDVVAFEYDHVAHKDADAVNFAPNKMPESFNKIYDINNIKYKYVKNLITKSTNEDYGPRSWYVQNSMVWMRMYRRSVIQDIRFDTKMHVFEDTLFWSRVLLRRVSGVITRLPLYYYSVNANSALHAGVKQTASDTIAGFSVVADEFRRSANTRDARIWYKRFLWSILSRVYRDAIRTTDINTRSDIIDGFKKMKSDGILNLAPGLHAKRYRKRILRFIAQNA